MKKIYLFFSLFVLCASVNAQTTVTWVGGTSSDFFTAANWSPSTNMKSLAQTEIVMVGNGSPNHCVHTGGSTATAYRMGKFNVLTGASMTVNGSLYPWATDSLNGNIIINNPGDLSIRNIAYVGRNTSGATITINNGKLSNSATAFNIAFGNSGSNATINVLGGSFNPGGIVNLANGTGLTALLNIDGGGVNIISTLNVGAGGSIFIGGIGFLKMTGDKRTQLNSLVTSGQLTCTAGKTLSITYDGTYTTAQVPQNPNSMITEYPDSVLLKTGDIVCSIEKATGNVLSYRYKGAETVANKSTDPHKYIYHDFTTSYGYETVFGATYGVIQDDSAFAHIVIKRPYNPLTNITPCDAELHYAIKKNDKGVYVYSKLEHKPNYKNFDIGSWRQLWSIAVNSAGIYLCEKIYTDSLRSWQMNALSDTYTTTSIAEIIKQTSGVRNGKYDGKYEYSLKFWDNPVWGQASNVNNIGCWMVNTSCEYYNEGPMHHDLNAAASVIHQCLNGVHYGDGGIYADTLTSWNKIFGPYLMLITDKANGDSNWAAAKQRQQAEQALWPYAWVKDTVAYPPASLRGNVTGHFLISDALKPAQTGANAWVGVTDLSDGAATFQMESKSYQYWVKADANGNFNIPNIRPGTYSFFAFVDGEMSEYRQDNVVVTAGSTTALGDVIRTIDRSYGNLAWEIGKADRTSAEFKEGDFDYCEGFVEQKFRDTFPNPIEYNVADNNWATKLCYAHIKYPNADFTPGDVWKWHLNFTLPADIPITGNARLSIAYASNDHAQQWIYVNNESASPIAYYPDYGDGNAFVRQSNFAKYSYKQTLIPMSKLKEGANTITLSMPSNSLFVSHLMYDYLSLEVPNATLLPVTLLSFDAQPTTDNKTDLSWQTKNETNNNYFDIQRSTDAVTFWSIGKVDAAINAINGSSYTFIDNMPFTGINYYRLKQVDKDGTATFSDIKKVNFNAKSLITVYPNPATNSLSINSISGSNLKEITVTDALGKSLIIKTNLSNKQYQLDISSLTKGIYFVKVKDEQTQVVQRITKN